MTPEPPTSTVSSPARFPPALTVLVVAALLYFARAVLIPVALAVLLTFLLAPIVRRLERLRIGRIASVLVAVGASVLAIATLAWIVQAQVADLATNLPAYKENIVAKLEAIKPAEGSILGRAEVAIAELEREISAPEKAGPLATPGVEAGQPVPVTVVEPPTPPLTYARLMLGPLISPLATTGIVIIFAIFMLINREDLRNRILWLFGERSLHAATPALDDAGYRVSRYLLMQLLANLAAGVAIAGGLLALGVPNAALWGLLTIPLRFVPYVGVWMAAVLPLATSIAVAPGWTDPLLVFTLVLAVELLVSNVLEPVLYGAGTGLSPVAIIAATVFWAWLWGPVGLVLATPLTVCLAVIGRHVPDLTFLYALLGDQPVLSPAGAFYQRLLARDQEEASRIVEAFAKDKPLAEVYDQLLVPALRLIETDRHEGRLDAARELAIRDIVRLIVEDCAAHPSLADAPVPEAGEKRRVVCVPARDSADELAAFMLSQLLAGAGIEGVVLSTESLIAEQMEQVAGCGASLVCISAVPPGGANLHCRVLMKRVQARLPGTPVLVGIWDARTEDQEARTQLGASSSQYVVTSLARAVDQIRSIVAARAEADGPAPSNAPEVVVGGGVPPVLQRAP